MKNREDVPELVDIQSDGVTVKMNTTRSKIKILPTSEDDRVKYTCEARHKALAKPQKVSVSLSLVEEDCRPQSDLLNDLLSFFGLVVDPPGAPRIDGYTEGEPIRENKSVTLVCVSRGGNPLAELIWYKNDVRIDSSYSTLNRESRNELTITATTKDNLARLRCEASNIMINTPKIADVVLTVMCKSQLL
ncbi:Nephrin [Orchesella cincta]|uniref:Nephrin n=1 Tax=Orchesella cincta TaxID=48709 RepID=A0A1D2MM12_ORCCI|nr:Nephrin [Orchesella cincta]